jgi:hypothetical protein
LISKRFVATYEQAGDFEVVNVNGKLQKNGGNVASYFCTADGRVIHAVGKNINAEKLLKEARWALDLYARARADAPDKPAKQAEIIQLAHLEELGTTVDDFRKMVKKELPQARKQYAGKVAEYRKRRATSRNESGYAQPVVPDLVAARRAAEKLHGSRGHQILAAQPFPQFYDVDQHMFKRLANEEFNQHRWRIESAADGLATAREHGRPIMLVLYQGQGKDKLEFDSNTKKFFNSTVRDRYVDAVVKGYVVIAIPLRELAALSTIADVPLYEVSRKSTPNIILTRPGGEQVAEFTGQDQNAPLVRQLWELLNETRLAHGIAVVAQGELSSGLKIMREVLRSPFHESVLGDVHAEVAKINYELAEQRFAKGRKLEALRLLRQVAGTEIDLQLRQRAERRIDEIRAEL